MLSNLGLEGLVFLLSLEGLVLEVLAVLGDVVVELVEGVLKTLLGGDEDVVDQVVTVE